jgi:hypothetical protein
MDMAPSFSFRNLGLIFLMTSLVGAGAYAVAWQFNDGKMTQSVIGAVCLGMAMPSLIMGGVMRLFRPDLQKYFAIMAGVCLAGGVALLTLA